MPAKNLNTAPAHKPSPAHVQKPSPAAKIAVVADATSDEAEIEYKADLVKLKDLLPGVVTTTGAKKKEAKDIVEAFLSELGKVLASGKSLALPPLGNIRVVKTQEKGSAQMLVLKLRMGSAGQKDTLAPEDEDS